jgi:integrase
MATIYRDVKRTGHNWIIQYWHEGKLHRKSSGTPHREQALALARGIEKGLKTAKKTKALSVDRAREIIAEALNDAVLETTGRELHSMTLDRWLTDWISAKDGTVAAASLAAYRGTVADVRDLLPKQLSRPIEALTVQDVVRFRDRCKERTSANTANKKLKILRVTLGDARKAGLLSRNVAADCPTYNKTPSGRKDFSLEEIKHLLATTKGTHWHGMILLGYTTGARLGDLVSLRWNQIDLERGEIRFHQQKTGRRVNLPLHPQALDWLMEQVSDDPEGLVFPDLVGKNVSGLFHDVLVSAGLAEPRTRKATKGGRSSRRAVSALSFHSLRHSAATALRALGATDVIAREILGHESEQVAKHYTHLGPDMLRGAIAKLPL